MLPGRTDEEPRVERTRYHILGRLGDVEPPHVTDAAHRTDLHGPRRQRMQRCAQPRAILGDVGQHLRVVQAIEDVQSLATNGPPPNVVPWSPGCIASATARVIRMAPIGSPPAIGFAVVRMSGVIPDGSCAQNVPVRP